MEGVSLHFHEVLIAHEEFLENFVKHFILSLWCFSAKWNEVKKMLLININIYYIVHQFNVFISIVPCMRRDGSKIIIINCEIDVMSLSKQSIYVVP